MRNPEQASEAGSASMWLAVIVVFGLMIAAWVTMFTIAAKNPIASVPLEHRSAEPSPRR